MRTNYLPWGIALFVVALVGAKFSGAHGFTSLLRFGASSGFPRLSTIAASNVAVETASSGYDGQFYAQIATSPLLTDAELDRSIDAPSYRARRIFLPLVAALLGLGHTSWTLQIFALLNVAAWAVLAWVLWHELDTKRADRTRFPRWMACMLSMGALESVRQSLVDLPAMLLVTLAIVASRRDNQRGSVLCSALANLTKETSVIAVGALELLPKPTHRGVIRFALSFLPIALWSFYVAHRFPGSASGLSNFTWPIIGAIEQFGRACSEIFADSLDSRYLGAIAAIPSLFLQAVVLWRLRDFASPWWRIGAAYALLLLFLGPWVWSGYWAACRAVLPMTIAFNLLLPANRYFWPLLIAGNITVLHAVWRFL